MSTAPSFLTEEMRQRAIGQESAPQTMDVEKGAIVKFAQAIGDDNPLYNDEVAAPGVALRGLDRSANFPAFCGDGQARIAL